MQIRKLTKEDLGFVLEVRNECKDCLHNNQTFSQTDIEQWFEKTNPEWYAIYLEDPNSLIGYFRTDDNVDHRIQIGCDIHKNYRGLGYSRQAYKIMLDYVFNTLNKQRVYLEVIATNTIALNLYLKLGFKIEGCKKQHILHNGTYIDSMIMGLLKNEYTTI